MASKTGPDSHELFLVAVNLTRRCNLACAHCYLDANTLLNGSPDELGSEEVCRLLDDIAARSTETMVVLTGGEPLMRPDLEQMVAHGTRLGLAMVIGTNGMMLTEKRVGALKEAGAMGVGISVDSLDPEHHDSFRGRRGAWEKTMAGIENCAQQGLPFQLHFSVTENNAHEVPAMIDFARASGARVLNVFFLVCTGRGESMSDITPHTYEQVLNQLVEAQERSRDLLIRARCAPHYKRIAYQRNPDSPLTRAAGYEGGGCLAGIHYCRITPEGAVTACPYIPDEEGSIRQEDFWQIWDRSPTFASLRAPQLNGKCGECEFNQLCGGCRARPLAMGGSLMDSDPWCSYQPQGGARIEPLKQQTTTVGWTPEAEQRLSRVPSFLRKMVKKRAEDYAREQGVDAVTTEHLATLSARRFGDAMPPRPGNAPATPAKAAVVELPVTPEPTPELVWSEQARTRLQSLPSFLRDGVRQVAEDLARSEGRLEVNVKLLDRLEAEEQPARQLPWTEAAQRTLDEALADKSPQARMFMTPALESGAEQAAKRRRAESVDRVDVEQSLQLLTGGVEWDPEALQRVLNAPDFIRAGIKKAAEFNARREGLARITPADLTRFRNRAMMRAVQRMKGFGMQELSFDAYEIARSRVPRLKGNEEADRRFATIRSFVQAREHPGDLLGQELLNQMKEQLRNNKKTGTRTAADDSSPDGARTGNDT